MRAALLARGRNTKARIRVPKGRSISSLTGLARCAHCGGRVHVVEAVNGRRRVACYNRAKGWECPQKSSYLDIYEGQIGQYLARFHIPPEYRQKIMEAHTKLLASYGDGGDDRRGRLEVRLKRLRDLYGWGDIARDEYLAERAAIREEIRTLSPIDDGCQHLDKLAEFLASVASAWDEANQEQRNRLARSLFVEVWLGDKQVVVVKPQPELKPFFDLNHEAMQERLSRDFGKWRPRGDSNP